MSPTQTLSGGTSLKVDSTVSLVICHRTLIIDRFDVEYDELDCWISAPLYDRHVTVTKTVQ